MQSKKFIILLLLSLGQCLNALSQMSSADSLRLAAQDTDFIHTYIDIASAGREVYSCFGHSAIRMTCPSKCMDFCFTFEMDMEKSNAWDFLTHRAMAGFAATETQRFLQQYKEEGRGVKQYELNLTPHEKQHLWQLLDKQVGQGSNWTFDYYHVNCSSMVLWVLESALDSAELRFTRLPECMHGNYHDAVSYMSQQSPWYGLVWQSMIIKGGSQRGKVEDFLAPRMMTEALPYAQIVDGKGMVRQLLKGQPQQVLPEVYVDEPSLFRPWMAGVLLLVICLSIIVLKMKRKKT